MDSGPPEASSERGTTVIFMVTRLDVMALYGSLSPGAISSMSQRWEHFAAGLRTRDTAPQFFPLSSNAGLRVGFHR